MKQVLRYNEIWEGQEYPDFIEDSVCTIQLITHHVDAGIPDRLGLRVWFLELVPDE